MSRQRSRCYSNTNVGLSWCASELVARVPPSAVRLVLSLLKGAGGSRHLTSTIPMATRSLSSVVSNLVRAQMGASVPTVVPDDDLDQHVAQLILKEARQKEARYKGRDGIRAYLSYVANTYMFSHLRCCTSGLTLTLSPQVQRQCSEGKQTVP